MEGQQWKLVGFVIRDEGDRLAWLSYIQSPNQEGIDVLWGKAFLEGEVLLLSPWKVHDSTEEFKTLDEALEFVENLPKWDKTTYFLKRGDFGHTGLVRCDIEELASEEEHDRIMPTLGFHKAKTRADFQAEIVE